MSAIVCENLRKTFTQGEETIVGLDEVAITIEKGEFVCLSGPSGSGKTTLLNAMGGLITPDHGSIMIGSKRIDQLGKGKLADMQRIFAVDDVAEYIWRQLDGERRVADIRDGVMDLYEVGKKQARADVLDFIEELKEADLISEVM